MTTSTFRTTTTTAVALAAALAASVLMVDAQQPLNQPPQRNLNSDIRNDRSRRLIAIDCPDNQFPAYVNVAFEGNGPIDLIWTVTAAGATAPALDGNSDNNNATIPYYTEHTEIVCLPVGCYTFAFSAIGASLEENLVNLELVVGDEGDFDDSGKGKGKSDKSGKGKSDDRRKLSKSDKSDKSGKGKSSAIEGSDSVSITADDVDGVIFDSERTAGGPRGTIDFCDGEITAADVFDANGNLVAAISNPPSPEPTDSFAPSITFSPTESPTGKGKSSKRSSSSDDSDDDRRARRQSRVRQLASATD